MHGKYDQLLRLLGEMSGATVAFSGGVDSTFLLAAAKQALDHRVLAVIGHSPLHPQSEHWEALETAKQLGVRVEVVETAELKDPGFRANPPDRCAICKSAIMSAVFDLAKRAGLEEVLDGSNADDLADYRPGLKAAHEMGVRSPLIEVKLGKTEIRLLSRELGLHTWDKPSLACLASRIPYGEKITEKKLARVECAETAVRSLGVSQLRVRDHGDLARIEVPAEAIQPLAEPSVRKQLVAAIKACGYQYICLDLVGYRTGSMNEVLEDDAKVERIPS